MFDYKPLTGELVRRDTGALVRAVVRSKGHWTMTLPCRGKYQYHRVVYAWGRGTDPGALFIDHINRNAGDNRLWNLRLADTQANAFNTAAKGYSYDRGRGNYKAQLMVDGVSTTLGRYSTAEQARNAYLTAKQALLIKDIKVEKV